MTTPNLPLRVRGGALRRNGRTLWSGLDLTIAPGEVVVVLGASGAGKTTLLRAILGLEKLSAGEISVLGEPVRARGNRRIGYLPQSETLPTGTALRGRDLLAFGVDGHRWGIPLPRAISRAARERHSRVDALLAQVDAADYADQPVGTLSGGQQQRLRIGQALADDPKLLLLDEPLTSLDPAHAHAVVRLVAAQRDRGAGVLLITHDIDPLLAVADRILSLDDGKFRVVARDEFYAEGQLA